MLDWVSLGREIQGGTRPQKLALLENCGAYLRALGGWKAAAASNAAFGHMLMPNLDMEHGIRARDLLSGVCALFNNIPNRIDCVRGDKGIQVHQSTVSRFPIVCRSCRESCFCVAGGTLLLHYRPPRSRGDLLSSPRVARYQSYASGRPRSCARADNFQCTAGGHSWF